MNVDWDIQGLLAGVFNGKFAPNLGKTLKTKY